MFLKVAVILLLVVVNESLADDDPVPWGSALWQHDIMETGTISPRTQYGYGNRNYYGYNNYYNNNYYYGRNYYGYGNGNYNNGYNYYGYYGKK